MLPEKKEIIAPEGGWKESTYYRVEVSLGSGNPVHTAVFQCGFVNEDGTPGSYSEVWCNTYERSYKLHEVYYMKPIQRLFTGKDEFVDSEEPDLKMDFGNTSCLMVTALIMPDCTIEIDETVYKDFPRTLGFYGSDLGARLSVVTFNGYQVGDVPVAWDANANELTPKFVAEYIFDLCKKNGFDFTQEEGHELILEFVA